MTQRMIDRCSGVRYLQNFFEDMLGMAFKVVC